MTMMKSLIALISLLQLSHTLHFDFNLNREIIDRLNQLHLNATYSFNSTKPLPVMLVERRTRRTCIHTFAKELSLVLNNVTVAEKSPSQSLVRELRANLKALGPAQKTQQKCYYQQIMTGKSSMIFKRFATFLRQLNNVKMR